MNYPAACCEVSQRYFVLLYGASIGDYTLLDSNLLRSLDPCLYK